MDEHTAAQVTLTVFVAIVVVAAYCSIKLEVRRQRHSKREQRWKEQLALELHPVRERQRANDQAHELQSRKQQADEYQFEQEFALKRYIALHYVPPETYIVNADLERITALPSLKPGIPGALQQGTLISGEAVLPQPFDMEEIIRERMPSEQGVFVARGAASGDIWVPPYKMCHVLGGGNTGGGKTIIVRNFAMQLAAVPGIQTYMYDPHASLVKRQPDGRLLDNRPLYPRLAGGTPITDAKDMCTVLEQMVRSEMEERKKRERAFLPLGPAIFVLVEELPILADESPEAIGYLARLLKRSRQYLIFLVCVSQHLLVKNTGLDTGDRSQYRTGLYTGGDDITAKVVLDLKSAKEIDESLLGEKGAVYSRTDVSPLQLSRVGYASNAACYELLGNPSSIALPDRPISETEWNRLGELLREERSSSVPGTGTVPPLSENSQEQPIEPTSAYVPDEIAVPDQATSVRAYVPGEERDRIIRLANAGVARRDMCKALGRGKAYYETIKQVLDEEGL